MERKHYTLDQEQKKRNNKTLSRDLIYKYSSTVVCN
jgi:hypothetical protein